MPTHDNPIIHIVLNGKGGIGKSTLATMLAQWKVELVPGCVTCIDTDPINSTFAAYTSLDVHRVEIMEDNNINPRRFDEIVELIMAHEHDAVIDAGATSFVALDPLHDHESDPSAVSRARSHARGPHRRRTRIPRHAERISRFGQSVR